MFKKQLQKVFFSNQLFPVTSKFFNVTLTDREPKQRLDMVHGSVTASPTRFSSTNQPPRTQSVYVTK